ncbi:flavin-containing monooxygenase [Amycolatopsis pithecellobii]|uniref:NAD(P)-binding protein n=1 Tax=Amycolatopsis pithecellobii TaxID=664692 RepID=A0A6N7YY27_9PSEU|nr:NAD(P)/FAD-dependent oxidoreductase [Amycolatopsis pithecellobii]MTD57997.1 NAD(P)-binding protein [Amycolatopsis pithecellobii]
MTDEISVDDLDFDPDEIQARYDYERDRRLREEGQAQYVPMADAFDVDEDFYAVGEDNRPPLDENVDVVVLGGGFGGMMMAVELRRRGVNDIRIVEAAADFGGTWYWNRYPGARCDVESYIYLPLCDETNYIPRERYSGQPEIMEHVQRIAETFSLRKAALFRTRITEVRWDEELKRWRVATDRGDDLRARFVVNASGPTGRPKLPAIAGIETFTGKKFHTSRWDFEYTGGDPTGGLHKLTDKKVAIIGTGATAIQAIPHLAEWAEHLYVFQRTPSAVGVRPNPPTDPEWAASLAPGWQRQRQEAFDAFFTGELTDLDLVDASWRKATPRVAEGLSPEDLAKQLALADMVEMRDLRNLVDSIVKDEATADLLKAWYPRQCKRPTFSADYLPTFNRPNVTLVDTSKTGGVERITETGIVVGDQEYDVDCIIFSTGFEISTGVGRIAGLPIIGRDGMTIAQRWSTELNTLHGHSVHGFPNWFFIGYSQNGLSFNYPWSANAQVEHIGYIIEQALSRGVAAIEATSEAEKDWVATIRRGSGPALQRMATCTPGYYNNEGKFGEGRGYGLFGEAYAPGVNAFRRLLSAWRDEGSMAGMSVQLGSVESDADGSTALQSAVAERQ